MKKWIYTGMILWGLVVGGSILYTTINKSNSNSQSTMSFRKFKSQDQDTLVKQPKNYEKHQDIEIDEKYNKKNLDLKQIPDAHSVKLIAKDLISLRNDKDVENFVKGYSISSQAKAKLPSDKENGATLVKYKGGYPENLVSTNVFIDYSKLKGTRADYLVVYTFSNTTIELVLTFEKMELVDIN